MPQIKRTFPGKSAGEIYTKVDEVMERIAEKLSLDYHQDEGAQDRARSRRWGSPARTSCATAR